MTSTNGSQALALFPLDALPRQLAPMEPNLEGWPLFLREKAPARKVIEIHENISTSDGRRLHQVWQVTALHGYSLPGSYDEDVFVGVMALVRRRGGMPADGKIRFSTYELAEVMRKTKRGGTWEKIRGSLDRIAATSYYCENAFYVAETESLETDRFGLWSIHLSKAKSKDGRSAEHHTLRFDDVIIRSYNAGYLKLLDTDLYFRLSNQRSPLAKALYRLVDQRRRDAMSWSVDVYRLRDLLAMSQKYRAGSKIWDVLQPAIRSLKREGYLESAVLLDNTARFRVHQDFARDWMPEEEAGAGLASGPGQKPEEEAPKGPVTLREQAIGALIGAKVHAGKARRLVDDYGPEKAFHVLEVVRVNGGLEGKRNEGAYIAGTVEKADPAEVAELARIIRERRALEAHDEAQPRLTALDGGPTDDGGGNGNAGAGGKLGVTPGGDDPTPALRADPETVGAAKDLWELVLADAERDIDVSSLRVWFEGIEPLSLKDGALTIGVPNTFAKEYIESRFSEEHLLPAIRRHANGSPTGLDLVVTGRTGPAK